MADLDKLLHRLSVFENEDPEMAGWIDADTICDVLLRHKQLEAENERLRDRLENALAFMGDDISGQRRRRDYPGR